MHIVIYVVIGLIIAALAYPPTREGVINTFVALVNSIARGATTDTERRKAQMQRGIAADKKKFNAAKEELQEAVDTVQTLRGKVITAQRHIAEDQAGVDAAHKEVLRVGRFIDQKMLPEKALVDATSACQAAEKKLEGSKSELVRATINVERGAKRIEVARAALKQFEGVISDEESNAALATSINLTNDIGTLAEKVKTDLGATSAEAIKQEVDRAQAGIDMQTDSNEEKMQAAEAAESAAQVLARVRQQSGEGAAPAKG